MKVVVVMNRLGTDHRRMTVLENYEAVEAWIATIIETDYRGVVGTYYYTADAKNPRYYTPLPLRLNTKTIATITVYPFEFGDVLL